MNQQKDGTKMQTRKDCNKESQFVKPVVIDEILLAVYLFKLS